MTYSEIKYFTPVNDVDNDRAHAIAESIREKGFVGAPILVCAASGILITGSHRLAALEEISEDLDVDEMEVAEDVQDIIDAWCEANDASIDDIDFSSLANVFAGTWVEQFKDEITEW